MIVTNGLSSLSLIDCPRPLLVCRYGPASEWRVCSVTIPGQLGCDHTYSTDTCVSVEEKRDAVLAEYSYTA